MLFNALLLLISVFFVCFVCKVYFHYVKRCFSELYNTHKTAHKFLFCTQIYVFAHKFINFGRGVNVIIYISFPLL
ncbi:hypothetical protein CGC57_01325 [Capnocytophaga sputigena]|nr:hypothetical protein CGC57_01325 [Capnocytophaga sputigena]